VLDALRPPKNPPILRLHIRPEEGKISHDTEFRAPSEVSCPASTTLPDELDLASLLWTFQLDLEKARKAPVPQTVVVQLAADGYFRALWTCHRELSGGGGANIISYEFCLPDGSLYSGNRTNADRSKPVEDWDGRLALFRKLPEDRFAGRRALRAVLDASSEGIKVRLQAVLTGFTGFRYMEVYHYPLARLSIQRPGG